MNWLRAGTATLRVVQSGIVALIDRAQTITGLFTFDRGTSAPFAVDNSSAAVVTNLDADKLDGNHATAFSVAFTNSAGLAALLSDETGTGLVVFATNPVLTTPNLGTPSAAVLTNATGLPTAGLVDAAVTLAKMANLAQDQFIGRTTASTGVPETATITSAARTVLDDTTVSAMVDTLGGATATGTGGLARKSSPSLVDPLLANGVLNADAEQVRLVRADNNTIRYHSIHTQHTATAATNYVQVRVHDIVSTTSETIVATFTGNARMGVGGVTAPAGVVDADQSSTTAAIPVLRLDQADESEGFVDYIGTSAASATGPVSTWTTGNTIQGFVRVEINGTGYWMPFYNAPTS